MMFQNRGSFQIGNNRGVPESGFLQRRIGVPVFKGKPQLFHKTRMITEGGVPELEGGVPNNEGSFQNYVFIGEELWVVEKLGIVLGGTFQNLGERSKQ